MSILDHEHSSRETTSIHKAFFANNRTFSVRNSQLIPRVDGAGGGDLQLVHEVAPAAMSPQSHDYEPGDCGQ